MAKHSGQFSMAKAILIAEDNADDTVGIRTTLRDAGAVLPMRFVSDGASVIAYLKGAGEYAQRERFPLPSILLLDLKMPRLDGFQVMEWVRTQKQFSDLLIVALSGHRDLSNLREAYMLGARSFLTKPCQVKEVQNLMRAYSTYWAAESDGDAPGTLATSRRREKHVSQSVVRNSHLHSQRGYHFP